MYVYLIYFNTYISGIPMQKDMHIYLCICIWVHVTVGELQLRSVV